MQSLDRPEREKRLGLANRAYERYNFGPDVQFIESDAWDTSEPEDFTRLLYITFTGEEESTRVSFHVRFDETGAVDDVYGLETRGGNEIGHYPLEDKKRVPSW